MRLSLWFTFLMVVCFGGKMVAQPYPVTTTLQLTSPNLPHLDAYTISTSNPLMLSTILNDVTQSSYDVRFKLTISGEGITIRTSDKYNPPAQTLFYNVPVVLTGANLAEYFNPDHLDFAGISKEQYLRDGKLPEGFYSVCFEAYDYRPDRELAVSNRTCSNATVQEHDPPIILSLIGEVDEIKPQFYYFTWQPLHVMSFPVEYELFIYEKFQGLTDDQILRVTPPVFRTTTPIPSYQYTPTDPILKTRQDYLIQVVVRDIAGNEYFKNEGKSKVETFSIIPPCVPGGICDDGLACTYDDRVNDACDCVGTPHYDVNNDGTCDELTLPPPLINFPERKGVCHTDGQLVVAWDPQHHINLDILYDIEIWQTGINVLETEAYTIFMEELAIKLEEFIKELGLKKNEFLAQQEQELNDFRQKIKDINEKCLADVQAAVEAFEQEMLESNQAFEKKLEEIAKQCQADKAKALEEFNAQIKKEQEDFLAAQQKAAIDFAEALDQHLANFKEKLEQQADDFTEQQAADLARFLEELTNRTKKAIATYETRSAEIAQAEKDLEATYQACLKEAANYKNTVRDATKTEVKALREEIAVINFAIETLRTKFQAEVQQLRDELAANMQGASRSEKRALRQAFRVELTELRNNFRATLAALKAKKKDYQNEIRAARTAQRASFQNADAAIANLQKECKTAYSDGQADLQKKAAQAAQTLANEEAKIKQDSIDFIAQQAAKLKDFQGKQNQQVNDFEKEQAQEQADFNAQQKQEQADFAASIKKRQESFEKNLQDCDRLVAEEKKLFEAQQAKIKADFEQKIKEKRTACSESIKNLEEEFLAQQAQDLANFEQQIEKEIAAYQAQQAEQEAEFIAALEAKYEEDRLVFTDQTDYLYYQLDGSSFEIQAGFEYEIRVRATDPSGVAVFENDGQSNSWPIQAEDCPPIKILPPPVALEATDVSSIAFFSHWTSVEEVDDYILEVAYDEAFTNLVPTLSGVWVNGTDFKVSELPPGNYCYRVRSTRYGLLSDYSNVICVELEGPCKGDKIGDDCDDGDPCTYGDRLQEDCTCKGINTGDADGDGVCDLQDICPGYDDAVDSDGDAVPDGCDDCVVGLACDDGDHFTVNDVYALNPDLTNPNEPPPPGVEYCLCIGTPLDELPCENEKDHDLDGVCDEWDLCEGHDDAIDSDGDGVPDGCDVCPDGDDHLDTDGDGISDDCPCDEATISLCSEELEFVRYCDYELLLENESGCLSITSISVIKPNETELITFDEDNNPADLFEFPYCKMPHVISCEQLNLTALELLAVHLNEWLNHEGYEGTTVLEVSSEDPKDFVLKIKESQVQFKTIESYCRPDTEEALFSRSNCIYKTDNYELSANITGLCDSPTYAWFKDGQPIDGTNASITISDIENIAAYSVVVTCDDNCSYDSQDNEACLIGAACDDYDPCTIDDTITECCGCVGTYSGDSDGDSVCDELDVCPGLNDLDMPDADGDGIADRCRVVCPQGEPCDDGLECTINDVIVWDEAAGACKCKGEETGDSDGDNVCDPLDQCKGFPDYADTDGDGIPDGCDGICVDASGNELNYCEAIKALAGCVGPDKLNDLAYFSEFLVQEFLTNPDLIFQNTDLGEIEEEGDDINEIEITDLTGSGNPFSAFNPALIVQNGVMVDSDGDGVCDLFDICEGDDTIDTDFDGLPDECGDCNARPNLRPGADLALYIIVKFDRSCDKEIVQPNGDICVVPGEMDCACECISTEEWDTDGDGVCNEVDVCHNGNDNLDIDGDGTPNACDEDDPCDLIEAPPCPPPGMDCVLSAYLEYNDNMVTTTTDNPNPDLPNGREGEVTGGCECIIIPDGDDDGDGICNLEDQCPGFDDEEDTDNDGLPDGCDTCPNNADAIGSPCDDGNDCTINDLITYAYITEPLQTFLEGVSISIFDDPSNAQEVANHPATQDIPFINGLESIFEDENGNYMATYIAGCGCKGVLYDSDYDGVCDGEDICPGYDDFYDPDGDGVSNNNFEDFDGDGIPDGCDPPFYEIGCPVSATFLTGAYSGIILHYHGVGHAAEAIPSPVGFLILNSTGDDFLSFQNIPATNIQNIHSEGVTEVLYEIPNLDVSQVYVENGQPRFQGEVAYSDGQFCYSAKDATTLGPGDEALEFACPSRDEIFVRDGLLTFILPVPTPPVPFDQNFLPQAISNISLTLADESTITENGTLDGTFNNGKYYLSSTIAVEGQSTSSPLSISEGTITFDTGLRCTYDAEGIVLNCIAIEGQVQTPVYIGEPCDDGDPLTYNDRYVENSPEKCHCVGELVHDADGDGVHDSEDVCPNGDDNIDTNNNQVPDACECPPPIIATTDYGDGVEVEMVQVLNGDDVKITLVENEEHDSYTITWSPNAPNDPLESETPIITIGNLPLGLTYTIEITAHCTTGNTSPSLSVSADLPDDGSTFSCLTTDTPVTPEDCDNISNLFIGDVVTIGGFEATIADITSANGNVFSGGAYVSIAMLGGLPIYFEFEAITIENCNGVYQVTDGELNVPTDGSIEDIINDFIGDFDPNDGNLLDNLETALDVVQGLVEDMTGTDDYYSDVHNLLEDITDLLPDFPFIDEELIQPIEDAMACMANVDPDAAPTDPNSFETCQNNMEQAIEDLLNQIANLYNADYQVPFYNEDNQRFGFDKQDYDIHQSNYDQIDEIAGEPYSVSWKSVRIGETDEVNARKKNGEAIPNIIFKDGQENEITDVVPIGDNFKQVTVQGQSSHGAVQEIFAIQTEEETANHDHNEDGTADDSHIHIAGKLNVVTYRPQTLQVAIVPVGGVSIPGDLAAQLTKIYMQAGVAVDVATVDGFNPTYSSPFPDIPSGWLSAYSPEMNDIIGAFQDMPDVSIDDDTYYVFVLPVSHEVPGKVGFMPKKRQYGFIFNGGLSGTDALVKTIAHELGHGAYRLKHTFETYAENPELNGEPSANLMDYGDGTVLRKYQWDLIHEPEGNFTLFDSDEEGEYTTVNVLEELERYANSDGTYTFVAPSGLPITLPPETSSVTFNTGDEITIDCIDEFIIYGFGTLRKFTVGNKEYKTNLSSCDNTSFAGYKNDGVSYTDELTSNFDLDTLKAIVGFPCFENNDIVFNVGKINVGSNIEPTLNFNETIPSNYTASGVQEDYDFLFSSMNQLIGIRQINGSAYPEYTTEAREFLKGVRNTASCSSPSALYTFIHAHQISAYPGFFTKCANEIPYVNEDTSPIAQLVQSYYDLPIFFDLFPIGDGETEPFSNITAFSEHEMTTWKLTKFSIYKHYYTYIQNNADWVDVFFNSLANVGDDNASADAQKLFDVLYFFKDYECAFKDLELEHRKKSLRLLSLLTMTEPNWFDFYSDADQEYLYTLLLSTTPANDYQAILDIFEEGNYVLLFRVLPKLNDVSGTGLTQYGYNSFVNQLSYMLDMITAGTGDCEEVENDEDIPLCTLCDQSSSQLQLLGYNPNFLTDNSYRYRHIPSYEGSDIRLVSAKELKTEEDEYVGTLRTSIGKPFEYVAIKFDKRLEFTFPNGTKKIFNEEETVIVPYIFADLIYRKYNSALFSGIINGAVDAIAIMSVIGVSSSNPIVSFVAVVDAAYGAIDYFVFASDRYLYDVSGDGNLPTELHTLWNETGAVWGAAILGGFIGYTGSAIIKFSWHKIKSFKNNLSPEHYETALDKLKATRDRYAAIPPLDPSNFADLQRWQGTLRQMDASIIAWELDDILVRADGVDLNFQVSGNDFEVYFIYNSGATDINLPVGMSNIEGGTTNFSLYPSNMSSQIEPNFIALGEVAAETERFGIYFNNTTSKFVFKLISSTDNILSQFPDLSDFWVLFQQKSWAWSEFNEDIAQWINDNLSSTQQRELLEVLNTSNWEAGGPGETAFAALRDDILNSGSEVDYFANWFKNGAIGISSTIGSRINAWQIWTELPNVTQTESNLTKISMYFNDYDAAVNDLDIPISNHSQWVEDLSTLSTPYDNIGGIDYLPGYSNKNLTLALNSQGNPIDGAQKYLYYIDGNDNKVILRLKHDSPDLDDPTNYVLLTDEINDLNTMNAIGLPTPIVYGITKHRGYPAMIMKKYEVGVKDISDLPQNLLTSDGIRDLHGMHKTLEGTSMRIDDLQYLVDNNGRFYGADPAKVRFLENGGNNTNSDFVRPLLNKMITKKFELDGINSIPQEDIISSSSLNNAIEPAYLERYLFEETMRGALSIDEDGVVNFIR